MSDGILTKEEVQDFLNEREKLGSVLGLNSIRELMNELGNVQENLSVIHVAGTNGKGSVCAMVSSVLQEAGYRVGMYTSPAVFGRSEQYQINGKPILEQDFAEIITDIKKACDRTKEKGVYPTLFEVETAAAFLYFYRQRCQAVLLETGMGGAMDATNIIRKPFVSVLTSISRDHMKFLGNSIEEIAREKAGIIKENSFAAAVRPKQPQVRKILEEVCRKKNTELVYAEKERAEDIHLENVSVFYGEKEEDMHTENVSAVYAERERAEGMHAENVSVFCGEKEKAKDTETEQNLLCFSYGDYGKIRLSMTGACQIENSICAIETAELLRKQGWNISRAQIRQGLEQARWEGRFSRLCREPLVVIDGAHNEDAAKKLRETLKMGFTNYKIIYIIGVLADKEYDKMLKIMMPLAWKVFTVTPNHPRALDGAVLAERAGAYHTDVLCCGTVSEGLEKAFACAEREAAGEKAMILAFGSLSYLGEIREIVRRNRL